MTLSSCAGKPKLQSMNNINCFGLAEVELFTAIMSEQKSQASSDKAGVLNTHTYTIYVY